MWLCGVLFVVVTAVVAVLKDENKRHRDDLADAIFKLSPPASPSKGKKGVDVEAQEEGKGEGEQEGEVEEVEEEEKRSLVTRRKTRRSKSAARRGKEKGDESASSGNNDNNSSNSNKNSNDNDDDDDNDDDNNDDNNENDNENNDDNKGKPVDLWADIYGAYDEMRRVALLPRVQQLCAVLITCRAGFAAADAITSLRLISGGVPKETLAMLGVSLAPVEIAFAVIASKMVTGPRPLSVWRRSYPFRIAIGLAFAASVRYVEVAGYDVANANPLFWPAVISMLLVHQLCVNLMFVSQMAFFARVSDPVIGGSYMTFLNTVTNLGAKWPNTAVMYVVDHVGVGVVDGYYVAIVVTTVLGLAWLLVCSPMLRSLEQAKLGEWRVNAEVQKDVLVARHAKAVEKRREARARKGKGGKR